MSWEPSIWLLSEPRRVPVCQVRLKMRTARSNEVSTMVQYGEAHLGLRYFADPHQEIVSRLVDEESLVVVHATHHNFPEGPPSNPLELAGVPWVGFPTGEGSSGEPFARILTQQLARAGLTQPEIITIDSLTAQKRLIEADFGLLPESSVQEELRSGTLSIVKIPALEATVPVMVLYRKQGYLSKAVRSLLELLVSGGGRQ